MLTTVCTIVINWSRHHGVGYIYILLTITSFRFLKFCSIFPQLISQNGDCFDLNLVFTSSEKCSLNPYYWVFFSDFDCRWHVLIFFALLCWLCALLVGEDYLTQLSSWLIHTWTLSVIFFFMLLNCLWVQCLINVMVVMHSSNYMVIREVWTHF